MGNRSGYVALFSAFRSQLYGFYTKYCPFLNTFLCNNDIHIFVVSRPPIFNVRYLT